MPTTGGDNESATWEKPKDPYFIREGGKLVATLSPICPTTRKRQRKAPLDLTNLTLPVEWDRARKMPRLIYGTAWKREKTEQLTYNAFKVGFRAIDTALQPTHYREDLVGAAINSAIEDNLCKREDMFIQTKFSPPGNQGYLCPYPKALGPRDQVALSIGKSRDNIGWIDCMLLHTPYPAPADTMAAWMEMAQHIGGSVTYLGVCNFEYNHFVKFHKECVSIDKLGRARQLAYESSDHETNNCYRSILPMVFQGPLAKNTGFSTRIRNFCRNNGIIFQGYWTLTGNKSLCKKPPVTTLARRLDVKHAVALYALFLGSDPNLVILDGTKNHEHMVQDITGLQKVARWSVNNLEEWDSLVTEFDAVLERASIAAGCQHVDMEQEKGSIEGVRANDVPISSDVHMAGMTVRAWQQELIPRWYD